MASAISWKDVSLQEKLQIYYQRLFPSKLMVDWLSYGHEQNENGLFSRREMSFTLDMEGSEVYIRYLSFSTSQEFVQQLVKKKPVKIDIGAVFSSKPKDKSLVPPESFIAVQKEVVIDIDLSDYNTIRTCCSEANICEKCWKFMRVAVFVIDDILRSELFANNLLVEVLAQNAADFGFKHLLWVYSGRRGIHCWISDERARMLDNSGRSAIADYLHVIIESQNSQQKTNVWMRPMHPSIRRVLENYLIPAFEEVIVEDQGLLHDSTVWDRVLSVIPDESFRAEVAKAWSRSNLSPHERWSLFQSLSTARTNRGMKGDAVSEVVLTLLFPRLDINVSRQLNHLLKAPFCVHPKTGRVCVPFDAKQVLIFDPLKVPTIDELLFELDDFEQREAVSGPSGIQDFEKTQMREAIATFQSKFLTALLEECARTRGASGALGGKEKRSRPTSS